MSYKRKRFMSGVDANLIAENVVSVKSDGVYDELAKKRNVSAYAYVEVTLKKFNTNIANQVAAALTTAFGSDIFSMNIEPQKIRMNCYTSSLEGMKNIKNSLLTILSENRDNLLSESVGSMKAPIEISTTTTTTDTTESQNNNYTKYLIIGIVALVALIFAKKMLK